jgi:hypothetical protein
MSEGPDLQGCAPVAAGAFIGSVVGFIASLFVLPLFVEQGQFSSMLVGSFINSAGCAIGAIGGALATAVYYDRR